MQTRDHKWRWMLALALACAVLLMAWATPSRSERDLLARATKVAGVQADPMLHPYGWLSDHEMLLFHYLPNGSWSLTRYDLNTRRESPLPALTALYKQSGGNENGDRPRISPNGRHFLWIKRKNEVFCSDLNGQHLSHQSQNCGLSSPCWLDNEHWAYLKDDKDDTHLLAVETHDIRSPYIVRRYLLSPAVLLRSSSNIEFPRLTLTPDLRLFVLLATFSQFTPVQVSEFSVSSRRAAKHGYSLPLPQQPCRPFLIASAQSPSDGRVAFVLLFQPPPPFWQPILHFLHLKDKPNAMGSLWVGDPLTGKIHEVGHIKIQSSFVGYGPIGDVRWLPDGKSLSFVCSEGLYTVPAD